MKKNRAREIIIHSPQHECWGEAAPRLGSLRAEIIERMLAELDAPPGQKAGVVEDIIEALSCDKTCQRGLPKS